MAPPTPQQITVATNALRNDAVIWDQESAELGKLGDRAEGLRLDRIEAGLFQIVFDTYREVINQVTARSAEGVKAMTEVGNTLRLVASTYDQEEAAGVHRMRNVY